MTVRAGCIKFIFKNVKSDAFVKLANLATISKKNFNFFLDRHTYLFMYICIINEAIGVYSNIAFSINIVKSDVKLSL